MPELNQFDLELYLQNRALEFQVEKLIFVLIHGDRRRFLFCCSYLLTYLFTSLLTYLLILLLTYLLTYSMQESPS